MPANNYRDFAAAGMLAVAILATAKPPVIVCEASEAVCRSLRDAQRRTRVPCPSEAGIAPDPTLHRRSREHTNRIPLADDALRGVTEIRSCHGGDVEGAPRRVILFVQVRSMRKFAGM